MRALRVGAGAAALLLLAACGGHRAVELSPEGGQVASRWNAVLATPAALTGVVQVGGTAWMGAGATSDQTIASITVDNAAPGGKHPWHVHRGRCGDDQGVFGPADAYEPLEVDGSGHATRTARLPMPLPSGGDFMVNVHASADNLGTIIACGNLAPPSR